MSLFKAYQCERRIRYGRRKDKRWEGLGSMSCEGGEMNGDDIGYAQYLEEQARQEEEQREWEESEAAAAQAEAETGAMEMEIKEEKDG